MARPFPLLYLLVDVPRTRPLAATLSAGPLGASFGAWLEAATVGRLPAKTLQWGVPLPDADVPGLRAWVEARPVCLMRCYLQASRSPGCPLEHPAEAICRSALRAVEAQGDASRPDFEAARHRLDAWYRARSGR